MRKMKNNNLKNKTMIKYNKNNQRQKQKMLKRKNNLF